MKQRGIFEKVPGSGVWWVHFYDASNKRRREKAGTKSAAIALYRKRKQEALEGRKLPEKLRCLPVSFQEIARNSLTYADRHKRSARNDHSRMEKLLEWFGSRTADSIRPEEIEARFHGEDWTAATWNRYRALLSLAYRLAIRAGKLRENVARLVPHKSENNVRVRFLSRNEEEKLRKAIRERFPEHESELDLALHTGLRLSEQYRALWVNVDFERRVLTVPLDKAGKTSHVRLNGQALHALVGLHIRTRASGFICGGTRSPRHWFESALGTAGIENFTWHCLRHTFASRLIMSGADLRTVAELLRDRTLAMVMRYAHLAPDYQLAAVERMGNAFPTATNTATELKERQMAQVSLLQ